jgi:hypothetical protein
VSAEARIVPRSRDEFMAAIDRFVMGTNDGMTDVFLEQAALCCRDSMIFTPPIIKAGGDGMSKEAKAIGENAIKGDVHSVVVGQRSGSTNGRRGRLFRKLGTAAFMNNPAKFWKLATENADLLAGGANKLYARMFNKGFGTEKSFNKLKNYFKPIGQEEAGNTFNRATIEEMDGIKQIHESFRRKFGGRIKKNGGPGINFFQRVEAKDEVLRNYIKKRQREVGRIKAGWVDALAKLPKPKKLMGAASRKNAGRSGIPGWIKRHSNTDGIVAMTRREVGELIFELRVGNRKGDPDFVATEADVKNLVYGNRVKQMPAMMEAMLKAHTEKFNKKHGIK